MDDYGQSPRTSAVRKARTSKRLHRAQKHNNKDFDVTVTIVAQESKTSTRKTLEAFWINAQNPEMNRKDDYYEMLVFLNRGHATPSNMLGEFPLVEIRCRTVFSIMLNV
ncbi:hypothetical protein KIN20_014407 [Parelaphostrongylus tenuis]|uniref:Uncharacterized protein n=1 Tax=Parelaphostrongylus tenuis TaxID=148309 RepID=A0AAD5QNC1_PARTN|nr:hypothetical protein KIN20_014407 [Parelaphostrongylus tenuis]